MRIRFMGVAGLFGLGICAISQIASAEDWEYPEGEIAPSVPAAPLEQAPPVAARTQWVPVAQPRAWYGAEIYAADALTISLTTIGLALASSNGRDNGTLAVLGYGSFALTAPVIHATHDRWGMSVASLGIRLGAPVLGLLYGAASRGCPNDSDAVFCGTTLATDLGLLGGMALATIIDASLFSWKNPTYEWQETSGLRFAPIISAQRKSGELCVFGSF